MPSSSLLLGVGSVLSALSSTASATVYQARDTYEGSSFLKGFNYFTDKDPTNGFVTYVDPTKSGNEDLIANINGDQYIGVDYKNPYPITPTGGRKSVRIETKENYNQGLFILDLKHMPASACGSWPAFWSLGSGTWPQNGEIDIIEGVNMNTANKMVLHTDTDCKVSGLGQTDPQTGYDCALDTAGTSGCDANAIEANSYGTDFNINGGGVYAMEWTDDAIKMWFFPRGNIPDAVTAKHPDTSKFGTPNVNFAGSCDIKKRFNNHRFIFDTTFCGDWAGNVYAQSSCPQYTGFTGPESCKKFVAENPVAFSQSYWLISYFKTFTKQAASSSSLTASTSTRQSSSTRISTSSQATSSVRATSSSIVATSSNATITASSFVRTSASASASSSAVLSSALNSSSTNYNATISSTAIIGTGSIIASASATISSGIASVSGNSTVMPSSIAISSAVSSHVVMNITAPSSAASATVTSYGNSTGLYPISTPGSGASYDIVSSIVVGSASAVNYGAGYQSSGASYGGGYGAQGSASILAASAMTTQVASQSQANGGYGSNYYTTIYTTAYVDVCPTGYTTISTTHTWVYTKPTGAPSPTPGKPNTPNQGSDNCPPGFTVTTKVCNSGCGSTPTTVTVTVPVTVCPLCTGKTSQPTGSCPGPQCKPSGPAQSVPAQSVPAQQTSTVSIYKVVTIPVVPIPASEYPKASQPAPCSTCGGSDSKPSSIPNGNNPGPSAPAGCTTCGNNVKTSSPAGSVPSAPAACSTCGSDAKTSSPAVPSAPAACTTCKGSYSNANVTLSFGTGTGSVPSKTGSNTAYFTGAASSVQVGGWVTGAFGVFAVILL